MPALRLGTLNVGRATGTDVHAVAERCDLLALQEMSDRAYVRHVLRRAGYALVDGTTPGQPATPLVYHPDAVRLVRPLAVPLLASRRVGIGAGPARSKPKWYVGGVFVHRASGRRVVYGSVHNLASQWNPVRARHAVTLTRALVDRLPDRPGALLAVGGDFNAAPDAPSLAPLRAAGWDHAARPTHGRRPIDHVWWRPRPWAVLAAVHTIATRSDHDALVAVLAVDTKE